MMGQPLLSVRALGKKFSGVVALADVSFDVQPGQIVGIIGPNGAGKTTLVNLITGLIAPSQGEIGFQGKSLVGVKSHMIARAGIGRTFQHIRLFRGLSVLENVLVGLDGRFRAGYVAAALGASVVAREEAEGRAHAALVLDRVRGDLRSAQKQDAASLPYADKRRLEIARALAATPRLLLLDEPAAGMAPQEIRDLIDDLKRLSAEGMAILLIEHKMRLIEGVTHKVVVLNYGQKIAEGPFDEVKNDPYVIKAYLGGGYPDASTTAG